MFLLFALHSQSKQLQIILFTESSRRPPTNNFIYRIQPVATNNQSGADAGKASQHCQVMPERYEQWPKRTDHHCSTTCCLSPTRKQDVRTSTKACRPQRLVWKGTRAVLPHRAQRTTGTVLSLTVGTYSDGNLFVV